MSKTGTVYTLELLNVSGKSSDQWAPLVLTPYETEAEARAAAIAYVDAWRDGRKVRVVRRTTTETVVGTWVK